MHHIHRTKAFVLKSFQTREADSSIILLTEEFGVIRATAQGARKMESKMRQSIQDFSLVNVALVSGRTGWRLVNAGFVKNFYTDMVNEDLRESVCRVFSLINRLIAGEVKDEVIYTETARFLDFSLENQDKFNNQNDILSFEAIFSAAILYHLGYLKQTKDIEFYLKNQLDFELILKLSQNIVFSQKGMIVEINRAIRDSHL